MGEPVRDASAGTAIGTSGAGTQYVIRRPTGDPHAARRLAAAYDACADAVTAEVRRAVSVLDGLGAAWHGGGARAARAPEDVLTEDAVRVARAMRRGADDLRHYAHKLAQAHEHHHWSFGRLVTLGAVVTVGVTAVVVTVGAAAPAEAALAAATVEGAEAASAAAGVASATVAADLGTCESLLAVIRPLAPFVGPHLVSAGASAGIDAVSELLGSGRLDAHSLEVAAAVGFAGSAAGGAVEGALSGSGQALHRLAEAGVWAANGTAGTYADEGTVDPLDSLAFGLTGVVARDVRAGVDEARVVWKLRVPEIPLGLDSKREWRDFVKRMYAAVDASGHRDTTIVWRGSSITGFNYLHGHAFDSLYRSDWDLALVGPRVYQQARAIRVRGKWIENRTFTIDKNSRLRELGLLDITRELSILAGRPVTWMIYKDMAAVAARPDRYLVVPRP